MAPEIHACLKQPNNQYDAFKADVFALGVSLFTLLFKQAPFNYAISEDRLFSLLMAGRTEEFWANHKES